jgi:hypothetical protein
VGYSPAARIFLLLFFTGLAILIMIPLLAIVLGTSRAARSCGKTA